MGDVMAPNIPPLGARNDTSRVCSRMLAIAEDGAERLCGQPAVQHIIYWWEEVPEGGNPDDGWDHGFACEKHWHEYQQRWKCAAAHPVDSACGMPGSHYTFEENRCFFDDLPTIEPVRAIAVEMV